MQSKDNKNAILAVVISGIILFGWNYFFAPPAYDTSGTQAPVTKTGNGKGGGIVQDNTIANNTAVDDSIKITKEVITLTNGIISVTVDNNLSVNNLNSNNSTFITEDVFKNQRSKFSAYLDSTVITPNFSFQKISENKFNIIDSINGFTGSVKLTGDNLLEFDIDGSKPFKPSIQIDAEKDEMDDGQKFNSFTFYGESLNLVTVGEEDLDHYEGKYSWLGLDFNYHLLAFIVDNKQMYNLDTKGNVLKFAAINPVSHFNYKVIFIKKNYDDLKTTGFHLDKAVDFGIWSIIAVPILRGLQYFYDFFQNYGLAIIFLTILMRLLTFPLQYKSFKSMKKMQVIQPELKIIKEKYKDDPKKVQTETMALFKKAGANPLGGCLPMLLQMPIFFAFYKVLFTSVELVDAPFYFWITDLSEKDPFYILPVLMGLAMFLNMKLTPSTTMDPAQQKVMMLMPVMFSIFMINLPSGLTLYILVSTVVGMLQQLYVYKRTA
jgi:YidC/Oxa1 family membrane protein insertase